MSDIHPTSTNGRPTLTAIELESIRPLAECAKLRGDSTDTIVREDKRRVARGEPSQIVRLSERRVGMRLKHALKLE
jgi:hypothetical protein